jgi:hypothetical protein
MKTIRKLIILLALSLRCIFAQAQIFYQDISPDDTISTWDSRDVNIDTAVNVPLSYGGAGNLTIWNDFGTQIDINAFSDCQVLMNAGYPAALNLMILFLQQEHGSSRIIPF